MFQETQIIKSSSLQCQLPWGLYMFFVEGGVGAVTVYPTDMRQSPITFTSVASTWELEQLVLSPPELLKTVWEVTGAI